MSRRHRQRRAGPPVAAPTAELAPVATAAGAYAESLMEAVALGSAPAAEGLEELGDAFEDLGTLRVSRDDGLCERLIQHDSMRWNCACGASGRVGRSSDGIPFVDDEILAHAPGGGS